MTFWARTILVSSFLLTSAAFAHSTGADPGMTGAPGNSTCAACHGDGTVNTHGGNVSLGIADASYTGGQKYRITITITDGGARRWGFELTARSGSGKTTQAGTFTAADGNSRVISQGSEQYITHTSSGTRRGTAGPVTFDVDWTAPAAGAGTVTFYVAANAANNSGSNDGGDHIYTSSKDLSEATASPKPSIRTDQPPALQSWGGRQDFASNSYLEIYGSNFGGGACASGGRIWQGTDFTGNNAPTSLAGTSVKVNGKPAFIYFVCDGQININTPDDTATGPVPVVVTTAAGDSNTVTVNKAKVSPALLTSNSFVVGGRQYVIAQTGTANPPALVGKPGLISGITFQAVKPGDSITLYALGLGPTNPAVQAGVINGGNGDVTLPLEIRIGGQTAQVTFKSAPAGTIGYYQINVVIPNIGPGDQPIEMIVDGVSNGQNLFLSNP